MTHLEQYKNGTNKLRENRRKPETAATEAAEDLIMDALDAIWYKLSDADKAEVECLGWMSWPDDYDKRVEHQRTVGGAYPGDACRS